MHDNTPKEMRSPRIGKPFETLQLSLAESNILAVRIAPDAVRVLISHQQSCVNSFSRLEVLSTDRFFERYTFLA